MKNILILSSKILLWIIILAAFASLGFITDNPSAMVPIYFIFFLLLFSGVLFFTIKRFRNTTDIIRVRAEKKEKQKIISVKPSIYEEVFGGILLLFAILMPSIIFRSVGFTFGIHLFLFALGIILIVGAIFSIKLINRNQLPHNLIGYILLVIIFSVPAFVMMQYDRSYHAMGTSYYTVMIIAVLAWSGLSLISRNLAKRTS